MRPALCPSFATIGRRHAAQVLVIRDGLFPKLHLLAVFLMIGEQVRGAEHDRTPNVMKVWSNSPCFQPGNNRPVFRAEFRGCFPVNYG